MQCVGLVPVKVKMVDPRNPVVFMDISIGGQVRCQNNLLGIIILVIGIINC